MTKEKTRIYVESPIWELNLELYLDNDLVEAHGGVESIQRYVSGYLCNLHGELLVPDLRDDMNEINAISSEKKLKIVEEAINSKKGLTSFLN